MSIFSRLSFLVRSDAHGVIDALENRRHLLRQGLRDLEQAVAEQQQELKQLQHEGQQRQQQLQLIEPEIIRLSSDIDFCLQQDNDQLAEFTTRKYVPLKKQQQQLIDRLAVVQEMVEHRQTMVQQHEEELAAYRVQVSLALQQEAVNAEAASADATSESASSSSTADGVAPLQDEVALELLRRKQQAEQSKAEPPSTGPSSTGPASTEAATVAAGQGGVE